ncbi:MAG: extracellular solute-binding protein [Capsulimonadales bacterium]|nr:extracellular solute-binding protein [Capsulimonadales bacterium]
MRRLFLLCFLLFVALYTVAETTRERPKRDGIVRMRWATDDNPARKVQTAAYAAMFPGKQVLVDPGLGGDQTKLIVQCTTGTGPDIIDVYDQANLNSLVQSGVLLDLTPYAKEMGFSPARTYPALAPALMVDGKQYRFPCNVWANCIIYNKAILDDHGIPYPTDDWTYDDLIAISKRIQTTPSKSGEKHMPIANWNSRGFFEDMLIGHGGRLFSEDGLMSRHDSPESIAALTLYHDMMYVHKVIPTPAESAAMASQGGWGSGGINWFSTGKAAMIVIGRWYIVQVPNFPNLKGNLGAVLLPRVGTRPSAGVTDTRAAGINAKSPRWREALTFLQYLASPEYSRIIVQDGDANPPDFRLAATGASMVNESVPDPAFHQPFVDALKNARPLDNSPFIDPALVARWTTEHVEKVENRLMTPEQSLKELAAQIELAIRIHLERRPDLRKKFEERTGRQYTADWWKAAAKP